jgi:hypothetical protein
MSEETSDKSSKVWLYTLGVILSLPLLYALSVGPAVALLLRGWASESVFESFYTPLISFVQATNTEGLWQSYCKVWVSATGSGPPVK